MKNTRSWNSPKSLWGIETTGIIYRRSGEVGWNSPKSLWGIETNVKGYRIGDRTALKFTKIPLRDWNFQLLLRGHLKDPVEIHQNPFEGLKPQDMRQLFYHPESWNSPKSLWGIETLQHQWLDSHSPCWNSPKSLWGIETAIPTDRHARRQGWNSPKSLWGIETCRQTVGKYPESCWNSPKSLWGIETIRLNRNPQVDSVEIHQNPFEGLKLFPWLNKSGVSSSWNSPKSLWGIETRLFEILFIGGLVEIHQNPFEGLKLPHQNSTTLVSLCWNSPKSLWGIETKRSRRPQYPQQHRWNSPKSLWGIETLALSYHSPHSRDKVEIHQNPFEGLKLPPILERGRLQQRWNSPKSLWGIETFLLVSCLMCFWGWNSPKSLWGIETPSGADSKTLPKVEIHQNPFEGLKLGWYFTPNRRKLLKFTKIPLRDWNGNI